MRGVVSALIVALVVVPSASLGASFTPLGDLPGGAFASIANSVSGDGRTVVGYSYSADGGPMAFRWTIEGGMTALENGAHQGSIAYGTSYDGSVSVGTLEGMIESNVSQSEAARWTLNGGFSGLGNLAGAAYGGALSVSGDGSVVVGSSRWESYPEAFRWSEATGLVGLGDLPGGQFESSAQAVSADGSVIVGIGRGAAGREAFRWTESEGMVGLGGLDLNGVVNLNSSAMAVSIDGSVIVGGSSSTSGPQAFRWTREGGMVGLGDLEGGAFLSTAYGVSGDGSVVVGSGLVAGTAGNQFEPSISKAFVWTEADGMQDLGVLLSSLAIDLRGWRLAAATDVSRDGRTIVGQGINPSGQEEAWIAVIPEPSTILLMGIGLAGLAARGARRP